MARFSGGYFPIPRAWYVEDPVINPFYKYKGARDLMVLLLQWATVLDTERCRRGQIVTSWEELAQALGITVSAARRRQTKLQFMKKADRLGDSQGLLITVIDYDSYTVSGQLAGRPSDRNPTDPRHHMEERKKERTPNRVTSWEAQDPLAKVFTYLSETQVYREVFDVPKDRAHLEEIQKLHVVTVDELAKVAFELKGWAEGPKGQKMKNPRATLTNFVKNHVKSRPAPGSDPDSAKPMKRL